MSPERPRRLGRGLEALISQAATAVSKSNAESPSLGLQHLEPSLIRSNPFQPRREFPEAELAELTASLQTSGLLQPIVVRRADQGFELISGERRLRAAVRLGWQEIPSIIREADDRTMLTLALIENLQRADLSVVEEATGYRRLQDEFQLTQHQIAEAVGKERSTVANLLRLLTLPPAVLVLLERNQITMGHARALLGLTDARAIATLAAEIVARQLTVRDVERRIRDKRSPAEPGAKVERKGRAAIPQLKASPTVRRLEGLLRRHFQTDVQIRLSAADKGTIEVTFYSADDLERLMTLLIGVGATEV